MPPPTVIHLHGMGSSPESRKAVVLGERLRRRGVRYEVPDLNVPSFERLTLTAVIQRVAEVAAAQPPGPLALVGSSFGGLAALHFVDRCRGRQAARVERLVLLAPALDLGETRDHQTDGHGLGDGWLDRWRRDGFLELPHAASGGSRPVHYGLVDDLRGYDSYAVDLELPTLIYHGRRDDSVPYHQSVRFAACRPNVTLRLLDADHSLDGQLQSIAAEMIGFLEV